MPWLYNTNPPANRPTITSITLDDWPTFGGIVAFVGTNFDASLSVLVGGNAATGISVSDSHNATGQVPAGSLGTADVMPLTNKGGGPVLTAAFEYTEAPAPPVVSTVSSPVNAEDTCDVTGLGFIYQPTTVDIRDSSDVVTNCPNVDVHDNANLSFIVPGGTAADTYDVRVTSLAGASSWKIDCLVVP